MPTASSLIDCPNCKKEGLRIVLTEKDGNIVCPLCQFKNQ